MKTIAYRTVTVALALICALSATSAISATKKAPPKRVVLGTTQMKGDQAQFGVTYTLGKTRPINVTLNSAEYTVEPVLIGNGATLTNADRKLLVLHYTLHNPNKSDYGLRWSTINITAVDANDTNWRYATNVGMEDTRESCNMNLKPAQKTRLYVVIVVPAKGEMPKVIFEGSDKLVLRYDLRGKVKPLPSPIADPTDPTGATALGTIPAQLSTYYPILDLHARIDSFEFSEAPIKGKAPKKGERYLIITGAAKNNLRSKHSFLWNTFKPAVTDVDGGKLRWSSDDLYFASRDEKVSTEIEPGQEIRFRFVYSVPQNAQLKTFSICQANDGRVYEYDLSQVK